MLAHTFRFVFFALLIDGFPEKLKFPITYE